MKHHERTALLLQLRCQPTEKLVLLALAHRWNPARPVRIRRVRLADDTGLSVRTLTRILKQLQAQELLTLKRTGRSTIFHMRWDTVSLLIGQPVPSDVSPCPIRSDTMTHQKGHCVPSTERNTITNKVTGGVKGDVVRPPLSFKKWSVH